MAILSQVIVFIVAFNFAAAMNIGCQLMVATTSYDLATEYLKAMVDVNVNLDDVNIYNLNLNRSSEKDYILSSNKSFTLL